MSGQCIGSCRAKGGSLVIIVFIVLCDVESEVYSYKSIADLSKTISGKINIIPSSVDLVVGIPRSGMLPGSIIALYLNTPLTDVYSYLDNRALAVGQTRRVKKNSLTKCEQAKHILVVDDSIYSGNSIRVIAELLDKNKLGENVKITYCCIYGVLEKHPGVDLVFEVVPIPRFFEWNIFHHNVLESACFDIDGVLCVDPTKEQNDDGINYINFILNAEPLFIPTKKINNLVTSRLEKYRKETECWLAKNGVEYDKLYMLDLPDAETRRRLGAHAKFKSKIYREAAVTTLFVESELRQAIEIANSTGKDVFCIESMQLIAPGRGIIPQINKRNAIVKRFLARALKYIRKRFFILSR